MGVRRRALARLDALRATRREGAASQRELFVLGIAQHGGMPHVGCDRQCCTEARRTGRIEYPVALGVVDHRCDKLLLVEATPRIEEQLALLHRLVGSPAARPLEL